jgi:hypothetical protein
MGDYLIGRRSVVVQLIDFPEIHILAEAEAVIGQQFVVDYVLVGTDECEDRPTPFSPPPVRPPALSTAFTPKANS